MFRVVIINAREDATAAGILVDQLRPLDLEGESDLEGADLRRAIEQANVVIALWSPHSSERIDLADAARLAKEHQRLVHVRIANVAAASEFGFDPSIDLTGWRGEQTFEPWRRLLDAISGVLYAPKAEDDSAFVMADAPTLEGVQLANKGAGLFETVEPPRSQPDRAPPLLIPRHRPATSRVSMRGGTSHARALGLLALVMAVGVGGSFLLSGQHKKVPPGTMDKIDVIAVRPMPAAPQAEPSAIVETRPLIQVELNEETRARRRSRTATRSAARAERRATPHAEQRYAALAPVDRPPQATLAATRPQSAPSFEPPRERRSSGEATATYIAPSAAPPPPIVIVQEPPRRRFLRRWNNEENGAAEAPSEELADIRPQRVLEAAASPAEADETARRERRLRRERLRQERLARVDRMQRDLDPLGRLGNPPLGVGLCSGSLAGLNLNGALSTRC